MSTKERNKQRKIKKRAKHALFSQLSSSFMWEKFDYMTYKEGYFKRICQVK